MFYAFNIQSRVRSCTKYRYEYLDSILRFLLIEITVHRAVASVGLRRAKPSGENCYCRFCKGNIIRTMVWILSPEQKFPCHGPSSTPVKSNLNANVK